MKPRRQVAAALLVMLLVLLPSVAGCSLPPLWADADIYANLSPSPASEATARLAAKTTWHGVALPEKVGPLNGVSFADRRHGWIVGDNGALLATDDGGRSWQVRGSPTEQNLRQVIFVDKRHGWLLADPSEVFATSDGGQTWSLRASFSSPESSPFDDPLVEVSFVDRDHGWGITGKGVILATADGGSSWVEQEDIGDRGKPHVTYSIAFADRSHGWAVLGWGWWQVEQTGGVLLRTADGGGSWEAVTYEGAALKALACLGERHALMVGDEYIFRSDDGAATWLGVMPAPLLTDPELVLFLDVNAAVFATEKQGWAFGWENATGAFILGSGDGGETWTWAGMRNRDLTLNDITVSPQGSVWVVGEAPMDEPRRGVVFVANPGR